MAMLIAGCYFLKRLLSRSRWLALQSFDPLIANARRNERVFLYYILCSRSLVVVFPTVCMYDFTIGYLYHHIQHIFYINFWKHLQAGIRILILVP